MSDTTDGSPVVYRPDPGEIARIRHLGDDLVHAIARLGYAPGLTTAIRKVQESVFWIDLEVDGALGHKMLPGPANMPGDRDALRTFEIERKQQQVHAPLRSAMPPHPQWVPKPPPAAGKRPSWLRLPRWATFRKTAP